MRTKRPEMRRKKTRQIWENIKVNSYLILTSFDNQSTCLSNAIRIDAISSLVFQRWRWVGKYSHLWIISRLSGKLNVLPVTVEATVPVLLLLQLLTKLILPLLALDRDADTDVVAEADELSKGRTTDEQLFVFIVRLFIVTDVTRTDQVK